MFARGGKEEDKPWEIRKKKRQNKVRVSAEEERSVATWLYFEAAEEEERERWTSLIKELKWSRSYKW